MDGTDKYGCQVAGITFHMHTGSTEKEEKVKQGYKLSKPQ